MTPETTWTPFFSLLQREVWRFLKVIFQTVFTPLINSTLYLMIFGVSLGQNITLDNGLSYLAFLIPGLMTMAALNNAFQNSSSSITIAKFQGELEDLRIAPISNEQIVWAISLGGLLRGLSVGTVTFVVGFLFYRFHQGEWLGVAHPVALLFFLAGGGIAFAELGLAVAMWSDNFYKLNAIGSFVLLPLIYLGGVFFSLQSLHPTWQTIAKFNPMLYFINGVRYGLLGVSDVSIPLAVAVTLLAVGVFYAIALRNVRRGYFGRW